MVTDLGVIATQDKASWTWEEPLHLGPNHGAPVRSVASLRLPGGGTLIISGAGDGLVRGWDATTGQADHSLGVLRAARTSPVAAVASLRLPDRRTLIVSGSNDGTIRRWDATTGEHVGAPLTGHTGTVTSVASLTLPGGHTLIVSGSNDGTIRRWDATTGEHVGAPLTGHTGTVTSVASLTLPGGRTLIVSGSLDGTIRRWDAETGSALRDPLTGHIGAVLSVACLALPNDHTLIISGSGDGTLRRWEATTDRMLGRPLTGHSGPVNSVACTALPNGRVLIISGGNDGTVRRWDASTGNALDLLRIHRSTVLSVASATLPDDRILIITGSSDGTVRRWDATTGKALGRQHTGHANTVNSVSTLRLTDDRTLIISGSSDTTVRRWDAATGEPSEILTGHASSVNSVGSLALPDGRTLIITGSSDKSVRRWDTTGRALGEPMSGHTGEVNAVASLRLPDRRTLIISGSDDGTIRRWDASTGRTFGDTLTGHNGRVTSVASLTLPGGRALIVSGSDDGTVRRWDANTGGAFGGPLTGHTGAVLSLACMALPSGRTLIISTSFDRTLRRWDAISGDTVGEPLAGHTGAVTSVAPLTLADGRTLIISGGLDQTLRRWDATTGEHVGDALTGHTAPVRSVATASLSDGRKLIISAADDWSIVIWPVSADGQVAGEPAPGVGIQAVGRTDETDEAGFVDVLGRGVLAAHLEELLVVLASKNTAGTAVVHIDGRWGSGKSRLITLLEHRLRDEHNLIPGRLDDPVLIHYDAWRESTVAPEWWSLATAIHRAVRDTRAISARLSMTLVSSVIRTVRSIPVLIAGAMLMALLFARRGGMWAGDFETLSKPLAAVTAIATLGLAVGRNLFWASPAFGRLYVRSDDNPLGQVATVVSALRRWSPRRVRGQRVVDSVLVVLWLAAGLWAVRVWTLSPNRQTDAAHLGAWITRHGQPTAAAGVAALIMAGASLGRRARARRTYPWPARLRRVIRLLPWTLRHWVRLGANLIGRGAVRLLSGLSWIVKALRGLYWRVVTGEQSARGLGDMLPAGPLGVIVALGAGAALGFALFSLGTPQPVWDAAIQRPVVGAALPLALTGLGTIAWVVATRNRQRRPLILVIDDIDRCAADRVVKLLETVHTLLREPSQVSLFPRWRSPAPLIVLVLGDGRWIRQAFEKSFDAFQPLSSDVHGLGADFLQKVFDHVILVPPLAADQVQSYVDEVTELSHWASTGRRRPSSLLTPDPGLNESDAPVDAPSSARHADRHVAPPHDNHLLPKAHDAGSTDGPRDAADTPDHPQGHLSPATASPASPVQLAEDLLDATPASRALGAPMQQAISGLSMRDGQRLAEEAATKAASKEAIAAFSEHLLSRFAATMPANPRLVTRVANAFGMLMTIRLHLNHHEDEDYIARAAIVMVRFPNLMDQLLSDADPPNIDPASAPLDKDTHKPIYSPWHRRDVQQVLRDPQGKLVDIVRLARCFGREYAPDIPRANGPDTDTPATNVAKASEAQPATSAPSDNGAAHTAPAAPRSPDRSVT